jgi:WD40 repeat protein
MNSGEIIGVLNDHSGRIVFKSNSDLLVSGGKDGIIRIWDINTLSLVRSLKGHNGPLLSVAISPEGNLIASAAADRTVRLWNLLTGEQIKTLTNEIDVTSLAFNPKGTQLIAGTSNGYVIMWGTREWIEKLCYQAHEDNISSISFSGNGDYFVTGSHTGNVKVWCSAVTGKEISLYGHSSSVTSISFSPKGEICATAAGQGYDGFDSIVRLWDTLSYRNIGKLEGHSSNVNKLCFSPDDSYIVTGDYAGLLKIWDLYKLQEVNELNMDGNYVVGVQFTRDGSKLIAASVGLIKIWDSKTWKEVMSFEGSSYNVDCLDVSSSGKLIASGGFDNLAYIWDTENGSKLFTLSGHSQVVRSVTFSPDDKCLATASWDKTVKIWDVETGKEIKTLKGHNMWANCVQFHPDGNRIFSGGTNYIRIWDVETGHELLTLDRLTEKPINTLSLYAIEFAPDGLALYTSGSSKDFVIWPCFPWRDSDYPGEPGTPLEERIKSYKRNYWKKRLFSSYEVQKLEQVTELIEIAVKLRKKAIELLTGKKPNDWIDGFESRLKLYQSGNPYSEDKP